MDIPYNNRVINSFIFSNEIVRITGVYIVYAPKSWQLDKLLFINNDEYSICFLHI